MGWAHVLRAGTPDRALIERAVEAIDRNATLQAQLISTVLDPSRIGEGAAAARTPASPGEDRESKGPLPALDGTRVLVVDDEEDTRSVVAAVLEQRGARVSTAASVNGAMARLADEVPDVVLADIGMPDEDGYSLMRRIRALPPERGGTVPAAALTAYARSEDRMQALLAGYQVHVPKPVQPAELIEVVATLAARRSATRTRQGA